MANNIKSKKALGAVVATALIIVVAVVAVMAFQNWFTSYQTSLNVKAESQGTQSLNTQIETIVGSTVFIKNGFDNLTINSVKVDGQDCNVSSSLNLGLQTLDVSGCLDNLSTLAPEVVIVTDKGVLSKTLYIKNGNVSYVAPITYADCSLDGVSVAHGDSITAYLSNSVAYGGSCTNETQTCSDGVLNGSYAFSSCSVLPLDCSTLGLSGGDWITVPGNSVLGTNDFCVMKYEAKWDGTGTIIDPINMYCGNGNVYNVSTGCSIDGSIGVTSVASSKPLTKVNQFEAIALCSNLGPNYHLINDAQWVTIARNAENISSNWFGDVVGTNFMYSGHNDYGMDGGINNAVSLDASTDNDGYYRTGDSLSSCDGSYNYFAIGDETISGRACAGQRRILGLSNGETIWDLGGNVWEWTNDIFTTSQSSLGQSVSNWYEWSAISGYDYLESSNSLYDTTYGIGRVYADIDASYPTDATWNTQHAFLRGGRWHYGAHAGAFALGLHIGPSSTNALFGFRCVYEP